jgi:AcrR family transcriptional regulator
MTDSPAPGTPGRGLRQRQREALEADLRRVAISLFEQRGFDEVTISEIAAEADVSERTFSRYFPTKDEVVLGVLQSFGPTIIARASTHPLESSWFELLRDTYDLRTAEGASFDEVGRVMRIVLGSPRLLAGMLARQQDAIDDIARIIAVRLDVDVDADPRPRAWATVTISIAHAETVRRVAHGEPLDGTEFLAALATLPEFMGVSRA